MKNLVDSIRHYLGLCKGHIETFYDDNGKLFVCFLCQCGKRNGIENIDRQVDERIKDGLESDK